ncbi:hypothetical protein ACIQM4_28125 [Streptomyces sp. NPDC091272]|uniref:hypothetical protein n=1 Tax=Streptomyces sp. NPDC091272 TaxID=3365981 RepID=UPI00380341E7
MSTTPIQDQYMQQLADDLARNAEEQEKARAQVEQAQKRLAVLAQEYTWLETMRAQAAAAHATPAGGVPAADNAPAAPATEQATAPTPVKARRARRKTSQPQTRTAATEVAASADAPAENSGPNAAEATETASADAPKQRAVRKPAAKRVPGQRATTAKTAPAGRTKRGPSLTDLVAPLLSADTPRSTKEVLAALREHHPERATSDQLVRNALNTLISRGKAQRLQQQNSVFYTTTPPQDAGVQPAAR